MNTMLAEVASIPNQKHPKSVETIRRKTIRTVNATKRIRPELAPSPGNIALFVAYVSAAGRASELLFSGIGQVRTRRPVRTVDRS